MTDEWVDEVRKLPIETLLISRVDRGRTAQEIMRLLTNAAAGLDLYAEFLFAAEDIIYFRLVPRRLPEGPWLEGTMGQAD